MSLWPLVKQFWEDFMYIFNFSHYHERFHVSLIMKDFYNVNFCMRSMLIFLFIYNLFVIYHFYFCLKWSHFSFKIDIVHFHFKHIWNMLIKLVDYFYAWQKPDTLICILIVYSLEIHTVQWINLFVYVCFAFVFK